MFSHPTFRPKHIQKFKIIYKIQNHIQKFKIIYKFQNHIQMCFILYYINHLYRWLFELSESLNTLSDINFHLKICINIQFHRYCHLKYQFVCKYMKKFTMDIWIDFGLIWMKKLNVYKKRSTNSWDLPLQDCIHHVSRSEIFGCHTAMPCSPMAQKNLSCRVVYHIVKSDVSHI